jgi:hypothetical protein
MKQVTSSAHSTLFLLLAFSPWAAANAKQVDGDGAGRFKLAARASELDPEAAEHPEIDFVFTKNGKPQDVQHAIVDTRVPSQNKLVIWLMGHNSELFDSLADYGLHAIQPHYANRWFSLVCQEKPVGEHCRGNVRLEAATGEDFSDQVAIPKADGMMHRATVFVRWLSKENPQADWNQFLTADGQNLRWDRVILAGASHGSTTAARFAKHQSVDRVVMFCGPRDQYQSWQALPSATPANRFFGFSHTQDMGWEANHYCRSWQMIGLPQFGPLVDVDKTEAPYGNTRSLITSFDVGGDANRAHSSVTPGRAAAKDSDGKYLHEDVWKYLFTHPVDLVGTPSSGKADCVVAPQ